MYELKIGELSDIEELLPLCRKAFLENPVRGKFSFSKGKDYLNLMLARPKEEVCALRLVHEWETVGFIIGSIVQDAFSDNRYAVEHHWYIDPDHRSFRNAKLLLDAFEYWSELNKVNAVYLSSGEDERLVKFLERKKYRKSFRTMIKEN